MRNAEPETTAPPADTAASVTCRPGKAASVWVTLAVMASLYCGLAVAVFVGSGPGSLIAFSVACFAFCVIGLVLAIFWARRGAIIADEAGLRWRGTGGWKSANWGEVSDYYVRRSHQNASKTIVAAVIETTAGRIKFGSEWIDFEPLMEVVERRATGAAAREWGLLGTRPCDPWPRRSGYDTFSNRWSPRLLLKLSLLFVVYALVQPALSLTGLAALLGWWMTLTTAALYLLLTVPLAILLLVRPLLDYRAVQKRMGERITLTPEGLVFEDDSWRIDARWDEVTGYGIVGTGKYTVETGGGAFDFLGSIGSGLLLRENIRLYATQAADTEWKAPLGVDALGGEEARWSGGQVGVGARVFHYRTRSVRGVLLFCLVLFLVCCATMTIIQLSNVSGSGSFVSQTALFVSMGFFWFLYGWRYFCVAGVHLDEDGLTQISPFGQTRLAWAQVRDFWVIFNSEGKVTGYRVEGRDGRRVRFGQTIVEREELKAEIARRAAHCGRTEWGKRLPA